MREPEQLPLLEWADKREVKIFPFPAERRVGRIRSIAKVMHQRKSEKGRLTYLRKSIDKYAGQLRSARIEQIDLEPQLQRFENAIWSEFTRLSFMENCS